MKPNVNAFDGWFRILLFITSLCYAIMVGGKAWFLLIPTGILFVTAIITWCPIYNMLGIDTNKEKHHKQH